MEEFRSSIYAKAKNRQYADKVRLTEGNDNTRQELKKLFRSFDSVFLHIYPDFVADFNKLLMDDQHVMPRESELLNTELRIYALIRHPMYLSLILLAWGAAVKDATWLTLGLALFVTACLYLTSRRDEKECLMFFGDAYVAYMQRSKRFIPWLW